MGRAPPAAAVSRRHGDRARPAGGLAAFRAVGVEQEIVKVPKSQVVAALAGRSPSPLAASSLKKDLAIHQQSEKARCPESRPAAAAG